MILMIHHHSSESFVSYRSTTLGTVHGLPIMFAFVAIISAIAFLAGSRKWKSHAFSIHFHGHLDLNEDLRNDGKVVQCMKRE